MSAIEQVPARKPRKKPMPKPADPRAEVFYVALGARVARLRNACGKTQGELAANSGFTVASICSIEKGRQRTPMFEIFRIFQALVPHDVQEDIQGRIDWRVLVPNLGVDPEIPVGEPYMVTDLVDDTSDLDAFIAPIRAAKEERIEEVTAPPAENGIIAQLANANGELAREIGLAEQAPAPVPSGVTITLVNDPEEGDEKPAAPTCRECGGALVKKGDISAGIHPDECVRAEADRIRKENGTHPDAEIVRVGQTAVSTYDLRIAPREHQGKEAFQGGGFLWSSRHDAALYLAASDDARARGQEVNASFDPNVYIAKLELGAEPGFDVCRARAGDVCGMCQTAIEENREVLIVTVGGVATDVGPCCRHMFE